MKKSVSVTSAVAMSLIVSGCGPSETGIGPTSGDPTSQVLSGEQAMNFGTVSTTRSANGLPFADEDFDPEDSNQQASLRVVRVIVDENGVARKEITQKTIPFGDNIPMLIDGEVLDFVLDDGEVGSWSATSSNGKKYEIYSYGEGYFSDIFNIYSYNDNDNDDEDEVEEGVADFSEGYFVLGLETNPEDLPSEGSVFYFGDVEGYGAVLNNADETTDFLSIFGEGTMEISFADVSTVNGSFNLEFEHDRDGSRELLLDLDGTTLVGNGFSTTLSRDAPCPIGNTCVSDTNVGGVLFGDQGEEISGIIQLDEAEFDGEGAGSRYIGVAGFQLNESPDN